MGAKLGQKIARWKRLEVRTEPPAVYWGGIKQKGFTPTQARLLFILARGGGRAPYEQLDFATIEGQSESVIRKHVHDIRKKLRALDIEVDIVSIFGWGYALNLIGDAAEHEEVMTHELRQRLLVAFLKIVGGTAQIKAGQLNDATGTILARQDGDVFTFKLYAEPDHPPVAAGS